MITATHPEIEHALTDSTASFVRTERDWFVIDREVQNPEGDLFSLLKANAKVLPSQGHYCIASGGQIHMRKDIPREDVDGSDFDSETSCATNDIFTLCRATNWPCEMRPSGDIAVQLDALRGAVTATVAPTNQGWNASVTLLTLPKSSVRDQRCIEAISRLLLRIAGCVRMVNPVAYTLEEHIVFKLVVHIPETDPERYLTNAFSALSVAVGHCFTECKALTDPALAALYLLT